MTHRLNDRVIWLVGRVALRAQKVIGEQLDGVPQRKQHYGILASLVDRGPAVQAQLAGRLQIDRSDLVTFLDELEAAGYVERQTDPDDRRRKIVAATPAGVAVLERLDTLVHAADDDLLAPLSTKDRDTLVRLLDRLLPDEDR